LADLQRTVTHISGHPSAAGRRQGKFAGQRPTFYQLCHATNCYSIVYYSNGAQTYKQFLQVGQLYRVLILLSLTLYLPSTSVSSVFMVLYRFKKCFGYILLFTF